MHYLLFCAHQAHHYGLEVMRGRVVVHAHQVNICMHHKSIHASCSCLPSVEMVVPTPYTPSPVSPAAQAEALLLTMCSLLGCFCDMLSHG